MRHDLDDVEWDEELEEPIDDLGYRCSSMYEIPFELILEEEMRNRESLCMW